MKEAFEKMKKIAAPETLIEKTAKRVAEPTPEPAKNKFSIPRAAVIAGTVAAVFLLTLIPLTIIRLTRKPLSLENPWERDDFRAVTLSFVEKKQGTPASFTSFGTAPKNAVVRMSTALPEAVEKTASGEVSLRAEAYSLPALDGEIRIQSLIGARYLLWYDSRMLPMLYDMETGKSLDLTERVFGRKRYLPDEIIDPLLSRLTASGWYDPEKDADGAIRRFLYHTLQTEYALGQLPLPFESLEGCAPKDARIDVDYLSALPECQGKSDSEKKEALFSEAWLVSWELVPYPNEPVFLWVPVIDAASGECLLISEGTGGSDRGWYFYNAEEDLLEGPVEDRTNCLSSYLRAPGAQARFTNRGTMMILTFPRFSSVGWSEDPDAVIDFAAYYGEETGIFDRTNGFTYCFSPQKMVHGSTEAPMASGSAILSESGNLLCYRVAPWSGGAKNFSAPTGVFLNRLSSVPHDDDSWIFFRLFRETGQVMPEGEPLPSFTLNGTFVRFAADESVIVMKRAGEYRFFDAANGKDITSSVRTKGKLLYAHEYYEIREENGALYRKHMITGTEDVLLKGDALCISVNGAFVFGYQNGENTAVCLNAATLESCRIGLDESFVSDLTSVKHVGFDFLYFEETNTLSLTFRQTDGREAEEDTVDFFGLLDAPEFDGERFDAYEMPGLLPALLPTQKQKN